MSIRVLVTDDSAFMRSVITKILEKNPKVGEIYEVKNGIEVVDMFRQKKPELITMDLDMPEKNGIDAAKEIKSFAPSANIVMVTSSTKTDVREEAEQIGTSGYITKPFNADKIHEVIDKV